MGSGIPPPSAQAQGRKTFFSHPGHAYYLANYLEDGKNIMLSRSSCLPLAPEGCRWACRAFPRCLPFATRSRPAAASVSHKTVGDAEGRRPRTACEAFWNAGSQKPSEDQEGPQLLSSSFGQKETAMPEERGSPVASGAQLGDLALMTFALFPLFFSNAFFAHPAHKLSHILIMGYLICTRVWSPTAVTRTVVALAPLSFVRYLQTQRALNINAVVGDDQEHQHTALMAACFTGNNERIRGLLSLGAGPDVAPVGQPHPLFIASHLGNAEAVEDLLRAGANANIVPGECNSPLEAACIEGHAGVVRALANAGALVDAPVASAEGCNLTPLIMAVAEGHVEVVRALLQAGASPTRTAVPGRGLTPIGIACAADDTPGPVRAAIVHLLLQAGADPRAVKGSQPAEFSRTGSAGAGYSNGGSGGPRAIDLAAHFGAAEVIPVLVAAGEDPGRAPADVSYEELEAGVPAPLLSIAAAKGYVDAVLALVAAGADVDATVGGRGAKGKLSRWVAGSCGGTNGGGGGRGGGGGGGGRGGGGVTALCAAVQEGHVGVVRVLAAAGASTQVLCEDGRTPLQVARDEGMVEMEEVLLAAGAA